VLSSRFATWRRSSAPIPTPRRRARRRGRGSRALRTLGAVSVLLLAHPAAADPAPVPAAEGAEDERAIFFDLGWDDGLTYALGYKTPIPDSIDPLDLARDVRLRGRIGASLALDLGHLSGPALDDGWRATVRRARFLTRGELARWTRTEYKFEFSLERGGFYLNDFYLRWRPARFVDAVKFGSLQPPVSLESIAASGDRSLMEVPAPVAAFAPGFEGGFEFAGSRASPDLSWALALTSAGQDQQSVDASDTLGRATGRLVWRPWYDAQAGALLHLGASVSYSTAGSGGIRYRARPESYLAPYLLDTDAIAGDATLVALEAAWQRGPLSLQGELFQSFVGADVGGSLRFGGGYLQASWVATGEHRPYDRAQAIFGRVAPRADFAPQRGRWGALELAARLSWLDLADGPVDGGRLYGVGLGVTWTWNRFVRLQAGYGYSHTRGGAETDGAGHILQARLELQI
jgi:phosphate-selective porin OprO/OprP